MNAAAKIGRNPVSKHKIQPEYGDEQADAGQDCRTRLARPTSPARTGTGKYSFFPIQLTTSRIGNLTRLILTLAIGDDNTYIHTYIHTYIPCELTSDHRPPTLRNRKWTFVLNFPKSQPPIPSVLTQPGESTNNTTNS